VNHHVKITPIQFAQARTASAILLYGEMAFSFLRGGEMINRRKDASLYTEKMSITLVHNEHGEMTHIVAMKGKH
jgi:hypothetical protein